MNKNNNQAFMKGALILLIANLVTKCIGMVFKIPLTYLIGEEGMGIFSSAYTLYSFMFVIATAGLPVAVSKMVSESEAVGNKFESKRILSVSFIILTLIGLSGALALYFGAPYMANAINCPRAVSAIKAIAPSIFFVGIMSAFRGFFQGHQNMVPTAWSEIIESFGKLVFGYSIAFYLMKITNGLTLKIDLGATGAVLGVSIGSFLGCLIISAIYFRNKKQLYVEANNQNLRSRRVIAKNLIYIAVPITLGASVFSLTSVIDLAMIMRRLAVAGFDSNTATALYGSYSGYAIPLFNMPATLISAVSISIVPAIASSYATGDRSLAKDTASLALKITTIFALPCAIGLSVLANPILHLVYKNTSGSQSMSILGYAVVFVSLVMVSNAILQAMQKEKIPVINMAIGGVFKIIVNYILVARREININGAPIGTIICYVVILVLNLTFIIKEMKIKLSIKDFIIKPVVSVVVMAICVIFTSKITSSMHYALSTLLSIGVGVVVYFAMILLLKVLKHKDITMLPKGDKIADIMLKLKIIDK